MHISYKYNIAIISLILICKIGHNDLIQPQIFKWKQCSFNLKISDGWHTVWLSSHSVCHHIAQSWGDSSKYYSPLWSPSTCKGATVGLAVIEHIPPSLPQFCSFTISTVNPHFGQRKWKAIELIHSFMTWQSSWRILNETEEKGLVWRRACIKWPIIRNLSSTLWCSTAR